MGIRSYLPWIETDTETTDESEQTVEDDEQEESPLPAYCDTTLTEHTYEVERESDRFTVVAKEMHMAGKNSYHFFNYSLDDFICQTYISTYSQNRYIAKTPQCDDEKGETFMLAVIDPLSVEVKSTKDLHFIGWTKDGHGFDEATIVSEDEYQEYGTDLLDVPDVE